MPNPLKSHTRLLALALSVASILVMILAMHWVERLAFWYFAMVGITALALAVSSWIEVPRLRVLSRLEHTDRIAAWILLVVLGVIGYLQNLNTWIADGAFFRPSDTSIWKTELVLVLALSGPLTHLFLSRILLLLPPVGGRQLVAEFALYVNFSGIALVLWTGDAGLSLGAIGALIVLIVLAELTQHACR